VDREEALSLLPEDYAVALRLREEGQPAAAIAARLGVDEEVIETLLEIGDGKLRRILEAE
jgi:DNA-directed RNA polymerase specialized sigma24 family protein